MLGLLATLLLPAAADARKGSSDVVVIANRGSGDISVIQTDDLSVETIALPGAAEPMYVNHDLRNDLVLVGDRASSTVVAFDQDTFEIAGTVDVGEGVFHQWYSPSAGQLWVVGDIANTVSVVDTKHLTLETTIDMPGDLTVQGAKPHDVYVSGQFAYVSFLNLFDGSGAVVQYSTRTFEEIGRVSTGQDPHLFMRGNKLYVASQGASTVERYNGRTLQLLDTIDVPNAHGIYISNRGEVLATNIAGGGTDGVYEVDRNLRQVRSTTDTLAIPHNLTVDGNRQGWVTHSGPTSDQVSVIDLERMGFGPTATVTVGLNPFGLAFVKR